MSRTSTPIATFRALRHPNFRLYFIGMVFSLPGTWMQNVAQSWLVYRLTNSEFLLGATWFATHMPVLLFGPIAGVAADRFCRRRIVLAMQVVAMLQALLLAYLTMAGTVTASHVLALAAVLGTVNAFEIPARQSLLVELAGKEDLLNAISLNSALFNMARIVGPSLAGLIVAGFGEGVCFLINALSFLAVIVCLAAMRLVRVARETGETVMARLVEGFRFAWQERPVRVLLLMCAAINLAGTPGMVLAPFVADGIFGRGSVGLGLLMTAMGLGAMTGTLVLARRTGTDGLPRTILHSGLLMGLSLAVFAWSPSFYLSLAVIPLVGFGVFRQSASVNTLVQTMIPDSHRGRIMAIYSMMALGFLPLGSLASGALARLIGVRWTIFAGAALCLAAAALYRTALPSLERWRSIEEKHEVSTV